MGGIKENIIHKYGVLYRAMIKDDYTYVMGKDVKVYRSKTGDLIASLKDLRHPGCLSPIGDHSLLVKNTSGLYCLYDTQSFTLQHKFRKPPSRDPQDSDFVFSRDGENIIDIFNNFPRQYLMQIHIKTGVYQIKELHGIVCPRLFFDEKNKHYVMVSSTIKDSLYEQHLVISIFSGFDGEINEIARIYSPYNHSIDYKRGVLVYTESERICMYDTMTKKTSFFTFSVKGLVSCVRLSQNDKYIVLTQKNRVQVYEVHTGLCLKKYDIEYGCFADFCDNDTKLFIGTWEKGYLISLFD